MNIEDFYLFDKTFFHVGCGSCTVKSSESVFIFASLSVYLGIRNVMLMMEKYSFRNAGEMIFDLSSNETKLKYHNVDDDEAVYLKGNHVRMYFSHIIICKSCYRYLYDFLNLVNGAIAHHPFQIDYLQITNDCLSSNGVPLLSYILGGDFDYIRERAYFCLDSFNPCVEVDKFM
jgi:hypothetical protein